MSVVDASLEERGELCLLEQFEYDISPLKVKLLLSHKITSGKTFTCDTN